MDVRIKRAYEPAADSDGYRVLVDRLWPRGVSKQAAAIDWWAKELSPSTELRKWFGHDPALWDEFQRLFREELHDQGEGLARLRELAAKGCVTLIFAAHDEEHCNAVVLQALLAHRHG
ncbi:MAG: DUF488 domain-containing protein [Xanthomonadales bacterium]|nr:DUF488 domain-containing protein [Xanthomonadales bacterium]